MANGEVMTIFSRKLNKVIFNIRVDPLLEQDLEKRRPHVRKT